MSRSVGLKALKVNSLLQRLAPDLRKRKAIGDAPFALDQTYEAPASNWISLCVAFAMIATVLMVSSAKAQDAEPRSYTNTPVGLNFLIAGYAYSQGKIAFDPTLPIADAQFHTNTEALYQVPLIRTRVPIGAGQGS